MTVQDLLDHEAKRPRPPFPTPEVSSPEWQAWRKAWGKWMARKEAIQTALNVEAAGITFERVQPRCTQRADYIYREPIKRRHRSKAA